MQTVTISQPKKLVFGIDSLNQFRDDFLVCGLKNLFILTIPEILPQIKTVVESFESSGIKVIVDKSITSEPTFPMVEQILSSLQEIQIDAVVGIGGGSALDASKVIAALLNSSQKLNQVIGIGRAKERPTWLACVLTTLGTGSEVSPNALLFDDSDNLKKAAISPWLVPDAAYIDPKLTLSVPPSVTAATGFDAMIHCIEAYTNSNAHPYVDLYALEGIRLIGENLLQAVNDGNHVEARTNIALASLYGGQYLAPVNTAAVHALAYPLGNNYHIGHGLSVAVLLPYVFEYNISANPEKHAAVAMALNAQPGPSDRETARNVVERIKQLMESCGLPVSLVDLGVSTDNIAKLADEAIKVERLLRNNPRSIKKSDIITIYKNASI